MHISKETTATVKSSLWGAAAGAAALAILGFTWGGWVTGGSAEKLASQRASSAVVAAIAPICVNQFQAAVDAPARLDEFKKVSSWDQTAFVEKAGWATMPGSDAPSAGVARACAELIGKLAP